MARYIFDIETNGFLDVLDRVHCLVIRNLDEGFTYSCCDYDYESPNPNVYTGMSIKDGLTYLQELPAGSVLAGHNVIKFDLPALRKVFPWFEAGADIRDTLLLSRLIWPEIRDSDLKPSTVRQRKRRGLPEMPKKLLGRHSLKAWGYRLADYKGDFEGPWDTWTPEMQAYCEQDVEVNAKLWELVESKAYAPAAVEMEHDFALIMQKQEEAGFAFDKEAAVSLYTTLSKRARELGVDLQKTFKPWWASAGRMTPPKDRAVKREELGTVTVRRFSETTGNELKPYVGPVKEQYHAGSPYTKVKQPRTLVHKSGRDASE